MRGIKKILFSIWSIFVLNILTIKNFVYADEISPMEMYTKNFYSPRNTPTPIREEDVFHPLYYIAIFLVITIIVGISILILRKIYKSSQLDKDEENEKGEKE